MDQIQKWGAFVVWKTSASLVGRRVPVEKVDSSSGTGLEEITITARKPSVK